jgi:hypothetical protein
MRYSSYFILVLFLNRTKSREAKQNFKDVQTLAAPGSERRMQGWNDDAETWLHARTMTLRNSRLKAASVSEVCYVVVTLDHMAQSHPSYLECDVVDVPRCAGAAR